MGRAQENYSRTNRKGSRRYGDGNGKNRFRNKEYEFTVARSNSFRGRIGSFDIQGRTGLPGRRYNPDCSWDCVYSVRVFLSISENATATTSATKNACVAREASSSYPIPRPAYLNCCLSDLASFLSLRFFSLSFFF